MGERGGEGPGASRPCGLAVRSLGGSPTSLPMFPLSLLLPLPRSWLPLLKPCLPYNPASSGLRPRSPPADESVPVPRPPHWGGFLVRPESMEFWQGRPSRLHDRLRYRLEGGKWLLERLSP